VDGEKEGQYDVGLVGKIDDGRELTMILGYGEGIANWLGELLVRGFMEGCITLG
jgi:hypothetical protein